MKTVTQEYLEGIKDGREVFKKEGLTYAQDHINNLKETIKRFDASSPVGQMLRGERDFWVNQIKKNKK